MGKYTVLSKLEFSDGTHVEAGQTITDEELEKHNQSEESIVALIRDEAMEPA